MAIENKNIPVVPNDAQYISKVKVGETTYNLKDTEARSTLADLEYVDTASGQYTPTGSISPTTITITPTTTTVQEMKTAGTSYSITDGGISQAESSSAQFPLNGMTATYDSTEENLTLQVSATTPAIVSVGTVTYTAPVLSGALPTFGASAAVVSSVGGTYTIAPTFIGTQGTVIVTPDTPDED